jgi:transcriptional regulator with XRE-family HTH domain
MNSELKGAKLKKIRLEKGITLEEIHKRTKINLNILKAIEGDSITNLSPVYLRGFIKIYCKFLGIEPDEFIADYQQIQPSRDSPWEVFLKKKSTFSFKIPSLKSASFKFSKKVKKSSFFILVIASLLIILPYFFKKIKTVKVKPQPRSTTQIKTTPKLITSKDKQRILTTSGIRFGIRTKENCWISVKVDDRVVFQRVLEKGRLETWQAKDRIELSVGNAGSVEIEVNGQVFTKLGRRGQALKNILITKEGLSIK